MALVSTNLSLDDESSSPSTALESQILPRCLHSVEITQLITNIIEDEYFNYEKLLNILNIYLETPNLLDPFINLWTFKLSSKLLQLIKANPIPNDEAFTPACQILYQLCKIKGYKSIIKHFPNSVLDASAILNQLMQFLSSPKVDWTCRYIFLIWMSLHIQCPFELKLVFRLNWSTFISDFINQSLRDRLLKGSGGKEMQAASIFLANFFKRPLESLELQNFIIWCENNKYENTLGILTCLVQIGKVTDDKNLIPNVSKIEDLIDSITTNKMKSSSSFVLKLILKLTGRIFQLKIKQGINVNLNIFLLALNNRDTIIRWTASKTLRRIFFTLITSEGPNSETSRLLCETLLSQLGTEFNAPFEASPQNLHGLLLAIGQLFNYRLFKIDKNNISVIADLIVKGLKFDQIKGSYAVGSYVRDAACYATWSLARYNSTQIAESCDHKIISGLTCMALFDREVAGRRAASAALQEFIGRIGGNRQISYLTILTHVHFFSVSALEKSFCSNAFKVGNDLPSIVPDLIDHLLHVSLFSFDRNVRQLAASTLGEFFYTDSELTNKLIQIHQKSDDLFAMHGALLAMAALPSDLSAPLIEVSLQAHRISPKSLGADLLLEGFLTLIKSVAIRSNDQQNALYLDSWLQTVSLGLKSRQDEIRQIAVISLNALSSKYSNENAIESFYLSSLTGIEKERDVNIQKGLLAALSTCPYSFFSKNGSGVIKLLIKTARTISPINDIEKRCVAIESINVLMKTFETEIDLFSVKELLISSLLRDYSIDSRGDVGSKIRLAGLKLAEIFSKCPEIYNLILEQAFGRLDRLRKQAMVSLSPSKTFDGEIKDFAKEMLENNSMPWQGAFRGLFLSCGGFDPEMTEITCEIIKQAISKRGTTEFHETALLALSEELLVIPIMSTISKLISSHFIFNSQFLVDFSDKIFNLIILKSTGNIRKLIYAFNLLIELDSLLNGKYSDFLKDQAQNHKFPVIRQLIFRAYGLQN